MFSHQIIKMTVIILEKELQRIAFYENLNSGFKFYNLKFCLIFSLFFHAFLSENDLKPSPWFSHLINVPTCGKVQINLVFRLLNCTFAP